MFEKSFLLPATLKVPPQLGYGFRICIVRLKTATSKSEGTPPTFRFCIFILLVSTLLNLDLTPVSRRLGSWALVTSAGGWCLTRNMKKIKKKCNFLKK